MTRTTIRRSLAFAFCAAVALVLSSRSIRTQYHQQAYEQAMGHDSTLMRRLRVTAWRIGIAVPRVRPNFPRAEDHLRSLADLGFLAHQQISVTNLGMRLKEQSDFAKRLYEHVGRYFEGKRWHTWKYSDAQPNVLDVWAPPTTISDYVSRLWELDAALGRPVEQAGCTEPGDNTPVPLRTTQTPGR